MTHQVIIVFPDTSLNEIAAILGEQCDQPACLSSLPDASSES
jgi:hypothetical protein